MIRYAILGTGSMANTHATKIKEIEGVELVACCDIAPERCREFAQTHGFTETYQDFSLMLEKCDFDAISIVTPDASHAALSIQALAAGKHVLCEKPLAESVADAEAMTEAARQAGVINMVNLSYRDSSALQRAAEMVRAGKLGRIFHVEAHYLQSWLTAKNWGDWKTNPRWLWRLSTAHGSNGVLGDVGVHILDFASFPVGEVARLHCRLKTFDKAPGDRIGDYVLDANDSAAMTLEFSSGALATVTTTRLATGHNNSLALSIHGEKGAVRIDLDRSYSLIDTCRLDPEGMNEPWETHYCPPTPNVYQRFITSIQTGVQDQPDFARGLAVQKLLAAAVESDREDRTVSL